MFFNPVQFWFGLQARTADANGNFFARFLINRGGDVYTYRNIECAGTLTAPNIYNKTAVDNRVHAKQNAITSSTDLTINKMITRTWEPHTGFTDVQIKAARVYFGNTTVWLTATSISVKLWTRVYVDQGITIQKNLNRNV